MEHNEVRCSNCRHFSKLEHNFEIGRGYQTSNCCVLFINENSGFVVEVGPDSMCEEFEARNSSYTAYVYEGNGVIAADLATYESRGDAISFAKLHNWDEVVDDFTGKVIWRR